MKYRFKTPWRQFAAGDEVPETLGMGVINTMLASRRIEPVPVGAKMIEAPSVDKMMRSNRVEISRKQKKLINRLSDQITSAVLPH